MARKTTVELIDDITGEVATETITFGVDGVSYEIDLSEKNAEELRSKLGTWVEKSRRIGGRAKRGSAGSTGTNEAPKIRAWAKENGYAVPERGRIPSEIRDAYEAGVPADKAESKAEKAEDQKQESKAQKSAPKEKVDDAKAKEATATA